MATEAEFAELKSDMESVKTDLVEIKSHCCNMKLIEQSIEARIKTNTALQQLSTSVDTLQQTDKAEAKKLDTLYKVLYLGMGALAVFELLFASNLTAVIKAGG